MDAARGQEDERGKIANFDTIEFKKLDWYLKKAEQEGKFVFVADMHGQANTFLSYAKEYETYQFASDVKKNIVSKT